MHRLWHDRRAAAAHGGHVTSGRGSRHTAAAIAGAMGLQLSFVHLLRHVNGLYSATSHVCQSTRKHARARSLTVGACRLFARNDRRVVVNGQPVNVLKMRQQIPVQVIRALMELNVGLCRWRASQGLTSDTHTEKQTHTAREHHVRMKRANTGWKNASLSLMNIGMSVHISLLRASYLVTQHVRPPHHRTHTHKHAAANVPCFHAPVFAFVLLSLPIDRGRARQLQTHTNPSLQ